MPQAGWSSCTCPMCHRCVSAAQGRRLSVPNTMDNSRPERPIGLDSRVLSRLILVLLVFLTALSLFLGLVELSAVDADGGRSWVVYPVAAIFAATATATQLATLEGALTARKSSRRLLFAFAATFCFLLSGAIASISFWKLMSANAVNIAATRQSMDSAQSVLQRRAAELQSVAATLNETAKVAAMLRDTEMQRGGTCGTASSMGAGPNAAVRTQAAAALADIATNFNSDVEQFNALVARLRTLAGQVDGSQRAVPAAIAQLRTSLNDLQITALSLDRAVIANRDVRQGQLSGLAREFDSAPVRGKCRDPILARAIVQSEQRLAAIRPLAPLAPVLNLSTEAQYFELWRQALSAKPEAATAQRSLAVPFLATSVVDMALILFSILLRDTRRDQDLETGEGDIARIQAALQDRPTEILRTLLDEDLLQIEGERYFVLAMPSDGFAVDTFGRQSQKIAALRVLAASRLVHAVDTSSVWARFQNWVFTFTRIPLGTYSRLKLELVVTGRMNGWLGDMVAARIDPRAYESLRESFGPAQQTSASGPRQSVAEPSIKLPLRAHGETQAADIFLSYSNKDQARAAMIADHLSEEGFSVWWDPGIYAGETYDDVIAAHLYAAKVVVVLWSPRSVASRWVRAEATYAVERGTLVPVYIEACDPPVSFVLVQTANLSGWEGDRTAAPWQMIVSGLSAMLSRPVAAPGPAPAHRQRPSEAIELAFWTSVQGSKDPRELRAYLDQFPDGHFCTLAHARLGRLAPK